MGRSGKKPLETLAPESGQPYNVPSNWQWYSFGAVADIYTGNSINETKKAERYFGQPEGLLYIATKDISFDGIVDYDTNVRIDDYHNYKIAPAFTSLLCIEGGSAGRKVGYIEEDVCFVNKLCAFVPREIVSKYIYFYLNSQVFIDQFNSKKHGLIGGVSVKELSTIGIAVPPLSEQHRIVDRIESLFAKLDEAKEKAQAVVDGYEDRKASILHQVFTGELTTEWRKQMTEKCFRKAVAIKDICSSLAYGTSSKSSPTGKVAVIRMGNLQGGEIEWENLVFSNNEADNKKYLLSAGDVLFNRTNSAEHVGKTAIYRGERPAIYAGYLIKIDYDHTVMTGEYLNYLLNSPEAKEYCNKVKTDAVNQSNINAQKIGAFTIPLIGIDEQVEICRLAGKMINAEKAIRDAAIESIHQIDTMKKAILARAFRGDLGTNDPSEPPADIGIS